MRPTFVQTCALLSSWRRRAGRARARDHGRARRREKGRLAGWEGRLEAREWAPQSDTIRPCTLHTRPRTSTDPPNEASLLCAGHFTLAGALLTGTGGELLPLFFRRPFYGPRAENQQERGAFFLGGLSPRPFRPQRQPSDAPNAHRRLGQRECGRSLRHRLQPTDQDATRCHPKPRGCWRRRAKGGNDAP